MRDRNRHNRREEPKPEWIPKSEIGKRVKNKEILSIEEIFAEGKSIMEAEMIDFLLPNLSEETLDIMNTQRMTDCGRKAQFRAIVLVGDRNGHVGIGSGKSEEVQPAIQAAAKNARRNIVSIPIGCGSWECGCKTRHSIPIEAVGKNGSVEVRLKPAPRGLGIAANAVVRKVLAAAGVKDAWSFSRGRTRNVYNMACAAINALEGLNTMRYVGDWKERASANVEKESSAAAQDAAAAQ